MVKIEDISKTSVRGRVDNSLRIARQIFGEDSLYYGVINSNVCIFEKNSCKDLLLEINPFEHHMTILSQALESKAIDFARSYEQFFEIKDFTVRKSYQA